MTFLYTVQKTLSFDPQVEGVSVKTEEEHASNFGAVKVDGALDDTHTEGGKKEEENLVDAPKEYHNLSRFCYYEYQYDCSCCCFHDKE